MECDGSDEHCTPSFGACMVAGDLYVIGGWSNDGSSFLTSVEKYSPASNTWSAVGPLPAGRVDHAAVAMGLALYVLGGETGDGVIANVSKLDSVHGSWSKAAPMPAPREEFASCACRSDIYVFGGEQASVFTYDTKANAWMDHTCAHALNAHITARVCLMVKSISSVLATVNVKYCALTP
jgi:N-acetylneuraminic acid mutarotase